MPYIHWLLSSAEAEFVTIVPVYVCLLATALLDTCARQLLDNS